METKACRVSVELALQRCWRETESRTARYSRGYNIVQGALYAFWCLSGCPNQVSWAWSQAKVMVMAEQP